MATDLRAVATAAAGGDAGQAKSAEEQLVIDAESVKSDDDALSGALGLRAAG